MKRPHRSSWTIALVLLHLIVAPCATAMMLMPANADCEHCATTSSPDGCAVAAATTVAVIEGVAFDSGRAAQPVLVFLEALSTPSPGAAASEFSPRSLTARRSGDPPLYLIFGQLRI